MGVCQGTTYVMVVAGWLADWLGSLAGWLAWLQAVWLDYGTIYTERERERETERERFIRLSKGHIQ